MDDGALRRRSALPHVPGGSGPQPVPPLVRYPEGEVKPLRVAEPRSPDADTEVLGVVSTTCSTARAQWSPLAAAAFRRRIDVGSALRSLTV